MLQSKALMGLLTFLLLLTFATWNYSYSRAARTIPNLLTWSHLSTVSGDLIIPGGSAEQTAALVLDIDQDGFNDFVIGARKRVQALPWSGIAAMPQDGNVT
jgi:hypothetical protein